MNIKYMAFASVFTALFSSAAFSKGTKDYILVYFSPDQPVSAQSVLSSAQGLSSYSLEIDRETSFGAFRIQVGQDLSPKELDDLIEKLSDDPRISEAEEDIFLSANLVPPNDSKYQEQWAYNGSSSGLIDINAESIWSKTSGNKDVTVAVIDTGYVPHDDMPSGFNRGWDFISDASSARDGDGRDPNPADEGTWGRYNSSWHGLQVSSIIAAKTNNGLGIAGLAPQTDLMHVRVLGENGLGRMSDISDAIIWASGSPVSNVHPTNAARVINLSLGAKSNCGTGLQRAIDRARANGAVVIAAAGNDSDEASGHTPANCDGVISVAAVNSDGTLSSYSNSGGYIFGRGYGVDLSAPGGEYHTDPQIAAANSGSQRPSRFSTYRSFTGTSAAAPYVSGAAALLLSVNPFLSPDQVETALERNAEKGTGCSKCGSGFLNVKAAVDAVDLHVGQGVIPAGARMSKITRISSPNGQYHLVMQIDGNLVLYRGGYPVWASNTQAPNEPVFATMQADGNFVLYKNTGGPSDVLWASNTHYPDANAQLRVEDTGRLAIYAGGSRIWTSN